MVERLFLLFLVAAGTAVLMVLLRVALRSWRRALLGQEVRELPGLVPGTHGAVLYFTTPTCAECRWRQEPALRELQRRRDGQVAVIKVDALKEAGLARRFRILTVPSTVVVDGRGRVRAVNYGFAPAEQLEAQLGLATSGVA
jgi:thiol-disulfide isomerase/thioredoxin